MTIYLDFDGTVVEHNYPALGLANEGCFKVIKKLQNAGHTIILNTYRANIDTHSLQLALDYLNAEKSIAPVSQFCKKKIEPKPWNWKEMLARQTIFIDDICEGIPLKPPKNAEYEIVDWERLNEEFEENQIYKQS